MESQLQDNLKSLANWNTQIQQIRFNPFALSLELNGAEITENNNDPVLSFDRLFINFSLLETLGGTIAFDEISLDQPVITLDVDESGTTNFQKSFQSEDDELKPSEEPVKEDDSDVVALFFDLIAINSGKINLSDHSQGENFTLTLEPLSLALNGFATTNNDGGDYSLSISLGNEQEINWQGQIGIAPFQSKGHLALKNIHSTTFWHYAKTASPYWLNQAKVSVSAFYDTHLIDGTTNFTIENSELLIEDAILSETAESEAFLEFKALKLAPINFNLNTFSLALGHIELSEPEISITRAQDSTLNILRPFSTDVETKDANSTAVTSNEDTGSSDEDKSSVFHWQISDITISDALITWHDSALSTPAELGLSDIDISIGALSDDLSKPFPYSISFAFEDNHNKTDSIALQEQASNKQILSGMLSPQPFALKGNAELRAFELASLQSYISEASNITVNSGRFSLQSQYDLSLGEQLSGTIESTTIIDELTIDDSILSKPLSGFKQLVLGPVMVSLPSQKQESPEIEIDSIVLDQPYGDVFIAEDGRINLAQLTKQINTLDEPVTSDEVIADQETDSKNQDSSIAMLLKHLEIKQGKFTFTDASLNPVFVTQVSDLSGSIEDISSDLETKSKVAFTGKVDSQGQLNVKGTLNPLSKAPNTDIKIKVNNVNMSMASPYSAKYAGYQIDKGKLDLDLNYQIEGNTLKASNQILLNQFEFGKYVDSPDATSLPLPLAIGILKDRKGKIDVNLPISGELDDPSFKLSSVILNTFVNLITKAVTSPFSMLGGLIEGNDDISEVAFAANSSDLSAEQNARILALAAALKERPNLTLEIRGIADTNIDRNEQSLRTEPELLLLAKTRANQMSAVIIDQGNIDANRVFILEPEIIPLKASETKTQSNETLTASNQPTIVSKFTLGVR